MQCYTQLTPPTAVTDAVCLPFLSSTANNLILAKTSLLQIYALKSVITDSLDPQPNSQDKTRKERIHTTKLVLISQHEVSGTITSLARVKTARSKSGGELLLVALKDAKLSLVEWDPEKHSISTLSIHYYERDDLLGVPWSPPIDQCPSVLTVDPRSRCAALKFGSRQVAVLPLNQTGDDLVMEDYDGDIQDKPKRRRSSTKINGEMSAMPIPYSTSFVLPLLAIDPALTHCHHLAFLHEYREPTIGILSSPVAPSSALLHERRDGLFYTVYTLDLEQRASTTLLSVANLPYDTHTIVALPLPVGGALLIGCNQLVHVDQAGKTNGVAVNEFAQKCSSFPLVSQSSLDLRLEGCVVEQLGGAHGEMLMILKTGELAILNFKVDGRSVSSLSIERVLPQQGGSLLSSPASCAALIGRSRIFTGSEDSDSVVLGWSSKSQKKIPRRRSTVELDLESEGLELDEDLESLEDDDLYAESKPEVERKQSTSATISEISAEDYVFKVHDSLMNLAPLDNVSIISTSTGDSIEDGVANGPQKLQLIATTGQGATSTLRRLSPGVTPVLKSQHDLGNVSRLWSLHVEGVGAEVDASDLDEFHNILVTSNRTEAGVGESRVYSSAGDIFVELKDGDFEPEAGPTIEVAAILGGQRFVQVLPTEIRTFEGGLSLAQIVQFADDAAGDAPKAIAASIAEPFIIVLLEDGRLRVMRADESGDLEEIEDPGSPATKWQSGALFDDVNDVFRLTDDAMDEGDSSSVLMFLLTTEGGLQIFRLPNTKQPLYTANGLSFLPDYLSTDFTVRRSNARESLVEILVAELGDATLRSPYLILRSLDDQLTLYSPYQDPSRTEVNTSLQFFKIATKSFPELGQETSEDKPPAPKEPVRILQDINGYSSVFLPGTNPCLVLKSVSDDPRIIPLRVEDVQNISALHTKVYQKSFVFARKSGEVFIAQLPRGLDYTTGWVVQRIYSGDRIRAFDYHEPSNRFVLATSHLADFKLPNDEIHPEWNLESTSFLPQLEQDVIKLLDPSNGTITDTFELDQHELVTCIKIMSLETSEITSKRRKLAVIGTAIIRGEDVAVQGCIYVLDVIPVVPEPDRPETGRKFKLVCKVKDRGAVTAISPVGTEGFVLVAQGQKCLVRGLKEDNSLLPVAFIDTQCYVGVAKELRGTGLCILGDAVRGLWLAGYSEDPYHLKLFGKTMQDLEVATAEFLPDGKSLLILIADTEGAIHVMQFDPHNPKSLSGQRLLHLSSFNTGSPVSTTTLLPRLTSPAFAPAIDSPASQDVDPTSQVLLTHSTGSLAVVTQLSTPHYRSLAALQSWLGTTVSHPLGLGPKAYRDADVDMSVGGRAILDGNVLGRWYGLGSWKQVEGAARAGVDGVEEVVELVKEVGGRGLSFF